VDDPELIASAAGSNIESLFVSIIWSELAQWQWPAAGRRVEQSEKDHIAFIALELARVTTLDATAHVFLGGQMTA
jgi:hypothetical protein